MTQMLMHQPLVVESLEHLHSPYLIVFQYSDKWSTFEIS